MIKKKQILMVTLGLGIGFSVQAGTPIATLSQIEGVVLVNQGKQFARAHNGMPLTEGDRILTMKESQVALRSEEYGCSSILQENSLLTIPKNLNCETLTNQETANQRYAALGDEYTNPSANNLAVQQSSSAATGSNVTEDTGGGVSGSSGGGMNAKTSLIIGGLVIAVGGGLAAGFAATSNSHSVNLDPPASPD
ncbi:MAG: hypothetical protein ACU4EQ_05325 [Candidatus Nitrosoglobus sp.]